MSSIEKYIDKLQKSEERQSGNRPPAGHGYNEGANRYGGSPSSQSSVSRSIDIDITKLKDMGIFTPDQGKTLIAEQYRGIKRVLLKNANDYNVLNKANSNTIMVTSALPGEGKSFTAISLSMSLSMERDYTVLLVETDLIKPAICKYMGINYVDKGLSDYLSEESGNLSDYILQTNVPKLSILPAGRPRDNTSELISSQNMIRAVNELASRHTDRIVIFDSSPLLLSNDSVSLSNLVGQVVFVVEAGKTLQSSVKDAYSMLEENKPIGIVINKNKSRTGTGGYGYGYVYGSDS